MSQITHRYDRIEKWGKGAFEVESFVRALVDDDGEKSAAMMEVIAAASQDWAESEPSLREDPGFIDHLFSRALLRQAIGAVAAVGEIPLPIGPGLIAAVAETEPWRHPSGELVLLLSPDRGARAVHMLGRCGWEADLTPTGVELYLPGLPHVLRIRDHVGMDGLFDLEVERIRGRAALDERSFGSMAYVPDPADGMILLAVQLTVDAIQGSAELRWGDMLAWLRVYPVDGTKLAERARELGMERVLHFALSGASQVEDGEGGEQLDGLLAGLQPSATLDLLARLFRHPAGSADARRRRGLLLYFLDSDPARAAEAFMVRLRRAIAHRAEPPAVQQPMSGNS